MAKNDANKRPFDVNPGKDSGFYSYPTEMDDPGQSDDDVTISQAWKLDLAPEEFSEGPYGAATNEKKLGKVSKWKPGQAFAQRFRDPNPISSNRTVVFEEPPHNAPEGSIEGQN